MEPHTENYDPETGTYEPYCRMWEWYPPNWKKVCVEWDEDVVGFGDTHSHHNVFLDEEGCDENHIMDYTPEQNRELISKGELAGGGTVCWITPQAKPSFIQFDIRFNAVRIWYGENEKDLCTKYIWLPPKEVS